MMLTRLLRLSFALVFSCAIAGQQVHADVYTWVDQSGSINVSNLAPPDGARVTSVIRAKPESDAARDAAVRELARQAETQTLAERVRLLEDEVQRATRQPQAQSEYRPVPMPPVQRYVADSTPAVQYLAVAAPPANDGCDRFSIDCGLWSHSGIYPPSIIVLQAPIAWRPQLFRNGHQLVGHRHPGPSRTRAPGISRKG